MKVLQVALALLVLPSSTEAHRRGGPRTKATEEQHRVQGPRGKAAKESERLRDKVFVPEAAKKKQAERAAVSAHQTKVKSAPPKEYEYYYDDTEAKCYDDYGIVTDKDWYDIDGKEYDCDWYAKYAQWRCVKFGSCFENFGKTANQACCVCAKWIGKDIDKKTVVVPNDEDYHYSIDYDYDACAPGNNYDDYCVPVNHQYDHPGEVTCDCVLPDDPCLTDMGEHGPHCIPDESCEGHMPDEPDYEVKSNSEMGAQTAEK